MSTDTAPRYLVPLAVALGTLAVAPVLIAIAMESQRTVHEPCTSLIFCALGGVSVGLGAWLGGRFLPLEGVLRYVAATVTAFLVWAFTVLNWPALGLLAQSICRL
ncbi:MAG: hypothetical protein AAFU77_14080 [Myxococcota bacterium]